MGGLIMKSTNENLLLWEQRFNEKNKSGMTIAEWCRKNGISKNRYHYWNQIINKKEKNVKEMTFAEITPILSESDNLLSSSDKSDEFQILYKNVQVTVPSNFNQNSLAGLMKVLQEL